MCCGVGVVPETEIIDCNCDYMEYHGICSDCGEWADFEGGYEHEPEGE